MDGFINNTALVYLLKVIIFIIININYCYVSLCIVPFICRIPHLNRKKFAHRLLFLLANVNQNINWDSKLIFVNVSITNMIKLWGLLYMFQNIETKNPLQIKQYIYIMFPISNWI